MKNRRLTRAELRDFRMLFRKMTDEAVAREFGFDREHVRYLAKKHGLRKSRLHRSAVCRKAQAASAKARTERTNPIRKTNKKNQ